MVTAEPKAPASAEVADESEYPFVELTLRLPAEWQLSWERLCELAELNQPYKFERSAEGMLMVTGTPPLESDWIENQLRDQIRPWMRAGGGGMLRGGASGYTLPDASLRVPDLSWIPDEMLPSRGDQQAWEAEPVLAPKLAIEIRSPGQPLVGQQRKMEKYLANGVQLGWLFDPRRRQVHVYRPEQEPEVLDDPKSLSGEDVMAGLEVDLSEIWP